MVAEAVWLILPSMHDHRGGVIDPAEHAWQEAQRIGWFCSCSEGLILQLNDSARHAWQEAP
eukprot:1156484-Pelagomonas_calceolata.AAC.4